MEETKLCSICKEIKNLECFVIKDVPSGRRSNFCKSCTVERNKEQRKESYEKIRLSKIRDKYERYATEKTVDGKTKCGNHIYPTIIKALKNELAGKIFCKHCGILLESGEEIEIAYYRLKGSKDITCDCCCKPCRNEFNRSISNAYKNKK